MIFDTLEPAIEMAERDGAKYVYRLPHYTVVVKYWTSTTFQHRPCEWFNPKVGV